MEGGSNLLKELKVLAPLIHYSRDGQMKKIVQVCAFGFAVCSIVLLTGMAKPASTPVPSPTPSPSPTSNNNSSVNAPGGQGAASMPVPNQALASAPIYQLSLNGFNGTNTSVVKVSSPTQNLLKIKIKSMPNATNPGFGVYGCMSVLVSVNNSVKSTVTLAVDGFPSATCPGASTFNLLDFSSDLVGNGPVNVTFSQVMSDNCYGQSGAGPYTYGCAMRPAYRTHAVSFSAQIQADGQSMMTECSQDPIARYSSITSCQTSTWAVCLPANVPNGIGGTQVCYRPVTGSQNCPNTTSWSISNWSPFACQSVVNLKQTWSRTGTATCINPTPAVCACPITAKPAEAQSCTCGGGNPNTCPPYLATPCARNLTSCGPGSPPPSPPAVSPTPAAQCSGSNGPKVQLVGPWSAEVFMSGGANSIVYPLTAKGYAITGADIHQASNQIISADRASRYVVEITFAANQMCSGVSNKRATGTLQAKIYRNNNLIGTSSTWSSSGKGKKNCNSLINGNYVKSDDWAAAIASLNIPSCQN
jgi:hypothetical protein